MPDNNDTNYSLNDEKKESACWRPAMLAYVLAYIIFACDALKKAADVGMGLSATQNTSLPVVATAATASFFSAIGLTGEPVKTSIDETMTIIKTRKLPSDWPILSKKREVGAILLTLIAAGYGAPSEALQTYYFFNPLPLEYKFADRIPLAFWETLSITIGCGSGLTALMTETTEAHQTFRKILANQMPHFTNAGSKICIYMLGNLLGLLKAVQDAIQGFVAMQTLLDLEDMADKSILGIFSMLDVFPNACFANMFHVAVINQFYHYLLKAEFKAKDITAGSLSLAIAVFLAFLKRPLNKDFYEAVAMDFDINTSVNLDETFEVFSYLTFLEESVRVAATLYLPMYKVVDNVTSRLQLGFNKICSLIQTSYQAVTNSCSKLVSSKRAQEEQQSLIVNQEQEAPIYSLNTPPIVDQQEYQQYLKTNPHLMFSSGFQKKMTNPRTNEEKRTAFGPG